MRTIEDMMKFNIQFAKKSMLKHGHLGLMFILHTEEGSIPIMVPEVSDEDNKRGILQLVQLMMLKHKAYAYSICMEAWMKQFDTKEEVRATHGDIEQFSDKMETIVISYVGHDRRDTTCLEIKRSGKGKKVISFGKPTKFQDMGGRFFELLPPAELIGKELDDEKKATLELAISLIMLRYKLAPIEVTNDNVHAT